MFFQKNKIQINQKKLVSKQQDPLHIFMFVIQWANPNLFSISTCLKCVFVLLTIKSKSKVKKQCWYIAFQFVNQSILSSEWCHVVGCIVCFWNGWTKFGTNMLNITKKYSLEPFRFTTMSTLPRNISDWDYETYGSQDWFVITFSHGWKQWPLDCILFSRVYFIPRGGIFLCLFFSKVWTSSHGPHHGWQPLGFERQSCRIPTSTRRRSYHHQKDMQFLW